MNKLNTIRNLEEALRIFWLKNANDADINLSEKELNLILKSSEGSFDMTKEKRDELVNRLFDTVNSVSLGQLINEAILSNKTKENTLAEETKLPVNILKSLREDSIFPNNVPVLILKGLLNKLNISFQAVERAIWKTFEMMQKREYLSLNGGSAGQSFRKATPDAKEHQGKRGLKSDGRELFENRESLEKYMTKLNELMHGDL